MKIVVFGANGKTGSLLVEQALEAGHDVIAYVRNPESIKLSHPKLTIQVGNLDEKTKLKSVISGSDACFSTLGGGSLTKHNQPVMDGIDTIVSLMEEFTVPRFIYMSSVGTGDSRFYMPQPIRLLIVDIMLRIPIADHNTNEKRISGSKLKWTVVRPGGLTDGPYTGKIKQGSDKIKLTGNSGISRSNVAAFMLNQLTDSTYEQKAAWLYEI